MNIILVAKLTIDSSSVLALGKKIMVGSLPNNFEATWKKALQIDIKSLGNMKVVSPHIYLNLEVYFSGFGNVFV